MEFIIINKNEYSQTDLKYFKDILGPDYYSVPNNTLIAHYHTKKHIAKKFNINISDVVFYKNKHGKPYCKYDIEFSISHSNEFIAVVFSNCEIGIDIEKKRSVNKKLFNKCFSENDLEYIDTNNFDDSFMKLWTIKEAYFKCIGTGITNLKEESIKAIYSHYSVNTIETKEYILSIVE